MIEIIYGEGRCELHLIAQKLGSDYAVNILGHGAHIGAVGVGCYDPNNDRTSSSVITLLGHKEDEIAKKEAERISKFTKHTVVLTVGIHLDNITKEEINTILENANKVVNLFLDKIGRSELK